MAIKIVKRMGVFAPDVTVDIEVTEEEGGTPKPMRLRRLSSVGRDSWNATYDFPMGSGNSLPKQVTVRGDEIEIKHS